MLQAANAPSFALSGEVSCVSEALALLHLDQVQDMVVRLLNLPGAPTADAADALACAICHAHGGQGLGALATAGYRVRGGRLVG